MNSIVSDILQAITSAKPLLIQLSPEKVIVKPQPDVWSVQEMLGHLIDSAANNHQRIVRAAYNAAGDFPPYNQDRWVEIQRYNEMEWSELVELFVISNYHFCRVIEFLPDNMSANPVHIGKDEPVTLEFVIKDYLRHLEHHLKNILGAKLQAELP